MPKLFNPTLSRSINLRYHIFILIEYFMYVILYMCVIGLWLQRWTDNPEVVSSNPTRCYISAVGEEGTG